ncbi:MAG: endonuclease III domain-containing protein [candidate division WOR-3 bacterium]
MRYSLKEQSQQPTVRFIPAAETNSSRLSAPNTLIKTLYKIYQALYQTFGPQHWWPGETTLEIIIGAVLTQNTTWKNVEKAIANLKENDLLNLNRLINYPPEQLARLLRPAGYYNIKTKRLLSVLQWLLRYGGIEKIRRLPTIRLRNELLHCYGVGPETADSILLYAFNRPVFVVDAYTRRILSRYGLITGNEPYEQLRNWLETSMTKSGKRINVVRLFNEFHALFVKLAKTHCRPIPICTGCPLNRIGSQ